MDKSKEIKPETIEKMGMGHRDEMRMVNPGATSFAELDEIEAAEEAADAIRKRTNQFNGLVENVMMDPDIEDKATAIGNLSAEFGTMAGAAMERKERWQPLTDAVVKALRPLFGKKEEAPPEKPETKNSFMVYKEAGGGYRWLAIYSNKFRDRDNPPEIISEASHLNFVKSVNSGELPYPELWLWHVEGSRWGEADFVGYDDNGFAVASGTVDKGREWVAESLMNFEGDLLTSHGMPRPDVERDPDDPTIITRHVTKEISPLPANVAANEYTGFNILSSEVKMALTDQDKAKLSELGVDAERLEAETERKAKETDGLEYKEKPTDTPAETEAAEVDYISRAEVTDLVKSVAESTHQMVEIVGNLAERLQKLEATNETTTKGAQDEEQAPSSLADLYKSVIGSQEARIDGRKALAKSGPEEAEPATYSGMGGLAGVIAQRNKQIERGVQ